MRTTTDTQTLSMGSDVFQTDVKQVFDFIRCSNDKRKLLELVENDVYYREMDDDAYDVVIKYTNSKELVKIKEQSIEGGKNNVCKAIRDLMDDSREEARKNIVLNMLKEDEPVDKICRYAECDEAYVEAIRKELETE